MITTATLGENLLRQYWKPSTVPKDKRLRLKSAQEQAKNMHLKGKAKKHGLVYSTNNPGV